jgi:hypothetical protein
MMELKLKAKVEGIQFRFDVGEAVGAGEPAKPAINGARESG